ncbi:MBL fold metallo-hydrolase [Streptomyces sp. GKU 257-1]|nr:MBL fold metallo-hydrolase [Streptomyces sp. GKU 257-1]
MSRSATPCAGTPSRCSSRPPCEALARLGHRPEDVRHILLSHLHRDHTGGLADFPEAVVHVGQIADHIRAQVAGATDTLHSGTAVPAAQAGDVVLELTAVHGPDRLQRPAGLPPCVFGEPDRLRTALAPPGADQERDDGSGREHGQHDQQGCHRSSPPSLPCVSPCCSPTGARHIRDRAWHAISGTHGLCSASATVRAFLVSRQLIDRWGAGCWCPHVLAAAADIAVGQAGGARWRRTDCGRLPGHPHPGVSATVEPENVREPHSSCTPDAGSAGSSSAETSVRANASEARSSTGERLHSTAPAARLWRPSCPGPLIALPVLHVLARPRSGSLPVACPKRWSAVSSTPG